MKYSFIFDEEFRRTVLTVCTDDEVRVVLATVLGEHNAMFYGYKPERLVNAVKMFSEKLMSTVEVSKIGLISDEFFDSANGNLVYVPNMDKLIIDTQRVLALKSKNDSRNCQYIATGNPEFVTSDLLDNFDIVYKCNEGDVSMKTVPSLKNTIKRARYDRIGWDSGHYIMGKRNSVKGFWFTSNAQEFYEVLVRDKTGKEYSEFIKCLRVARSLSDADDICNAKQSHILEALRYYKEGKLWNENGAIQSA